MKSFSSVDSFVDILESNHHHQPSNDGETYPISDHDSSITSNDLIDTNNIQQGENDEDEQLEFARKSNTFNRDLTVFFFIFVDDIIDRSFERERER